MNEAIFEVAADIRRAETLHADFYTNERYFRESKEKIFARSWQLVGLAGGTDNLKPHTILEGFLDEPILFVRSGGELNCFSNVCTHRGKILVAERCRATGIRCGYHGRRFDLKGRFLSMPEFDGVENFPSARDDLTQIPYAEWGGLLFASVSPRATFAEFIAPVRERVGWLNAGSLKFSETLSRDYFVNAHWALYCENYLEGFHIPFVHHGLNQAIDYGSYRTETFRFASVQIAEAKDAEAGFDLNSPAVFPGIADDPGMRQTLRSTAAFYFFIFPNLMLNFYPWGLSVNIVKPLQPDLTRVSYLTLVADESKLKVGAGADLCRVELEDQAVVESVQRGIRSRFYGRGRYSPAREQGTHHFHRLVAEFMNKD